MSNPEVERLLHNAAVRNQIQGAESLTKVLTLATNSLEQEGIGAMTPDSIRKMVSTALVGYENLMLKKLK